MMVLDEVDMLLRPTSYNDLGDIVTNPQITDSCQAVYVSATMPKSVSLRIISFNRATPLSCHASIEGVLTLRVFNN